MTVNWDTMLKATGSVLGALVAWTLGRVSEKRPKLIVYYGHASRFFISAPEDRPPPAPPVPIHTHSVIIRNVGKKTATNVRLSHQFLPADFVLFPAMKYTREPVPGAGDEIVIPALVPDEQVTINYLYYPPVTFAGVNTAVKSDAGFARYVNALPTPKPSRWVLLSSRALIVAGAIAVVYLGYAAVAALLARL